MKQGGCDQREERRMSAKSLAKRFLDISSRGGVKANTKELMKRWTVFVEEKVRKLFYRFASTTTSSQGKLLTYTQQYAGDSTKEEASDFQSYFDELKQFEVCFFSLSPFFVSDSIIE